jgi:hypothetical protein
MSGRILAPYAGEWARFQRDRDTSRSAADIQMRLVGIFYGEFVKHKRARIASVSMVLLAISHDETHFTRDRSGTTSPRRRTMLLIILIILLLVFGFGGYRLGPGMGYYGGGGISLIILIVIILLLLKVI